MTLIGVLVATLILTSGALAVAGLMAQTEKNSGLSQEKFVAANLAREGLELVQAYRDHNWFVTPAVPWALGICDDRSRQAYRFIIEPDEGSPYGIAITPVNTPRSEQASLYLTSTDDRWTHRLGPEATKTAYKRDIVANCTRQNNPAISEDPAYIVVTAEVSWESRGRVRTVKVNERLFNWLPGTGGLVNGGGPASCPNADPVVFALLDVNPVDGVITRAEAEPVILERQTAFNTCTVAGNEEAVINCLAGYAHYDVDGNGLFRGIDILPLVNTLTLCAP
jgi:hypothetical protein